MELRHLRYFVAIADEGSVSAAARDRLHTAQPSLSRQLKDLERELGVDLFERRVRGIALTRSGQLFLGHVRQILKQVDDAIAAVRDAPLTLRVGIIPGLETVILPQLRALCHDLVGLVTIEITSIASTELVDDLRDGNLDLAFVRPSEISVDLHFEPIGMHAVAVVLPRLHPLASRPALTFADLAGQTYISVSRRVAPFLRGTIDRWGQQRGLALAPTHVAADIASAFSLIMATDGFSLIPDYVERLMPAVLTMRPLVDGPVPLMLAMAFRPQITSPVQTLVADLARIWPRT